MPILNIGSINIDHVYRVDRFVAPGETKASAHYTRGLGGKGMNQSIALSRAGATVCHVGAVGETDTWVRAQIKAAGVDDSYIAASSVDTGHAIIQVDDAGENCILLYEGANHALQLSSIQAALAAHPEHRWVLLQNEINLYLDDIMQVCADDRKVAMNPAPCTDALRDLPLEKLALLVVNEVEALQLSGLEASATVDDALRALNARCPETLIVMTLGAQGIRAALGSQRWQQAALPTEVVDTTAAGDTVTGYLMAMLDAGASVEDALYTAAQAASITVSRLGAASSIPLRSELRKV